jgi:hypothetical protein
MFFALTPFLGQMKLTKRSSARADGLVRTWEESRDRGSTGGLAYDTVHFGALLPRGRHATGFAMGRFAE